MKIFPVLFLLGLLVLFCGCTTQTQGTTPASVPPTVLTSKPAVPTTMNSVDLTGVWIGKNIRYVDPVKFRENISIRYNITSQSGPGFTGVKEYTKQSDGKTYGKNFSGIIAPNGKVYLGDEDQGYNIGRMTGDDSLEMIHLVDGSVDYPRTWVGTFTRPSAPDEPIVQVQTPDITGTWSGSNISYLSPDMYTDHVSARLSITAQKGPVFRGEKESLKPKYGKTTLKNFTGVVSSTGEIYIADEDRGYNIGKFTDSDTLEIVHFVDGSVDYPRVFLGTFTLSPTVSTASPLTISRNITGTWVARNASSYVNPESPSGNLWVKYTIREQNGPVFEGFKEVVKPTGGTSLKNFTGVMTSAGEVYIGDEDKGYNIGKFTGPDTLEIVHLADGIGIYPKTWIGIMNREKS